MANTTVGIVFEVYNKGTKGLSSLSRDVSTIGRTLKGLTATALGLAGVGSITYALTKTAEGIDRIAKSSDRLGLTTQELSSLEYAASLAGVETHHLEKAMEQMARKVSEAAQGTGEAKREIAGLGLSAAELVRQSPQQMLYTLADALAAVESPADRVRIAMKLFGESGVQMLNVLQGGSQALRATQQEAERLRVTFNRVDAAQVEKARVALTKTKAVLAAGLRTAVIEMAPYVAAVSNQFTEAAASGEGFGMRMTAAMESVALAAAKVLDLMEKISGMGRKLEGSGYSLDFAQAIEADTRARYELELEKQGRQPYTTTNAGPYLGLGATRSPKYPDMYEAIKKQVTALYAPYSDPAKANPGTDHMGQVERFFAGVRQRVAEARARNEAAAGAGGGQTTAGLSSQSPAEDARVKAMDELIARMQIERDLAGQTAEQREQTAAIESARKAALDDYTNGLRTSKDLTDGERQTVQDLVAQTDQIRDRAAVEEHLRSLQQENESLALIRQGRQTEAEVLRTVNQLKAQGIELTGGEVDQIRELVAEQEKLQQGYGDDVAGGLGGAVRDMQKELGGLGDLSYDLTTEGIDGVASSLANAAVNGEDLNDSLKNVVQSMAAMAAQWAIQSALTSAMGGLGFGGASAKGNVFGTTGLIPFAQGGIVDRPTVFPFARGAGLMGEAGPEGILPLDRDSQGRLGVHAAGSGGGRMEGLLGQILTALRQRQPIQLQANIVDTREVVTRGQMEGRDGEAWTLYHVGRNQ